MRLLGRDWVSFKVVVLGPTFAIIMLPIGIIGAAFDAVFWNIYAVRSRPLWRFRPEISTVRAWCRRVRSSRNAIRDSLLPPRIDPPSWVLQNIPIHTRPVHQPQRVGLEVPPRGRVVVAHPVLVEAVRRGIAPLERSLARLTALEPLAGEAVGREGSGGGVDAAEGGVGGGPDFHSGGVGREDRAGDVVGADEVDRAAFDHRDRLPGVPDIFADRCPNLGRLS